MPASCAIFTQSSNGKKASDARLAPFSSKLNCFAFSIACLSASILEVCPQPLPTSCLFLIKAIALLFKCLQMILPKSKSAFSFSVQCLAPTSSQLV
jgi:hypothetical protein